MNIAQAVAVVVVPFLPVLFPGIFLVPIKKVQDILPNGARILLTSMAINTIVLMVGLWLGVSVVVSFIAVNSVAVIAVIASEAKQSRRSLNTPHPSTQLRVNPLPLPLQTGGQAERERGTMNTRLPRRSLRSLLAMTNARLLLAFISPLLVITALFAVPFFMIQNGLPTGDVQKTIVFAEQSVLTHQLPDYQQSLALLNRDPSDFYTPGLHSVSALVLALSPAPLTSIGLFSIIIVACIAFITASLAKELFPKHAHRFLPLLAVVVLLSQYRFLRYVREPGYHYQNAFGEFLLFGLVLLFLSYIARKRAYDAVLFFTCAVALFFTHQFSVFIAGFAFLFGGIALAIVHYTEIKKTVVTHIPHALVALGLLSGAGVLAFTLGLIKKVPAIFTLHPHLSNLLPNITDYTGTMGHVWFITGFLGLLLLMRKQFIFASIACGILLLSQGPALGVDIPPIRAMFYSALPLSITGAYFFWYISRTRKLVFLSITAVVIISGYASISRAFGSISHAVRTNSSLTAEQVYVINELRETPPSSPMNKGEKLAPSLGILIDDYNKRSASWFVLSGHPMFTRISSDLQTQMNEAGQSKIRNKLYMNQLDYEKIFALGSMPEIGTLFARQSIGYVTGIFGSSDFAFNHNPALVSGVRAGDTTIYSPQQSDVPCGAGTVCEFLLRPTTLANDIGDDEDTFEHLQVSIRATQLSDPQVSGHLTYRATTARFIPFEVNVADYVQALWPEYTDVRFVIRFMEPMAGISLLTTNGTRIPLSEKYINTIMLAPDQAQVDARGFITLTIDNPMHAKIGIDYIAVGL